MNNFFEKYRPFLFWAGLLADSMTEGQKLAPGETTKQQAEKLLRELSEKYHLVCAANFSEEEELAERQKMTVAGWEPVTPCGMCTKRLPFRFCIYGAPKKAPAPPLPGGLEYGDVFVEGFVRGELSLYGTGYAIVK